MGDFVIEIYNAADETMNFGTRSIDISGNLYEAVTLVVIFQPDVNELVKLPHIKSFVEDGKVFLTLDRKLTIFSDQSCSHMLYDANFDQIIDVICLCDKYLLMGLRNGIIHILDTNTFQIVSLNNFKENVWIKNEYFIESFVETNFDGKCSFLIINNKGVLCRIVIGKNENGETIIKDEVVFEFDKPVQLAAFFDEHLVINFEGNLAIYNVYDNELIILSNEIQLKKVYTYDNNQFIALTADGKLMLISTMTYLITIVQREEIFNDLIFYENNNEYYCLVSLKTEEGFTYMKMLNYYDFSEIYSIKLTTQDHYLVKLNDCGDNQLFVSLVENQELRMQQVCETLPEQRLERLLRKKSFDEAEAFAILYKLDLTKVHMARAQAFVDKSICNSEEVTKLLSILSDLDDYDFQVNCCLNVACYNYEDVRRVLSFGSTLNMSKSNNEKDTELKTPDIKEVMYKFNIYTEFLRCNNEEFDANEWTYFSSCNLYDSLYAQLKEQNIEACIILYLRMDDKIINFTDNAINGILSLVDKMPFHKYLPFLKTFIPKTLTINPKFLNTFVQWTKKYIYSIEKNDCVNFPDNAIYFIKNVVQLFKVDTIITVDEKISNIVESLNTIQILKNNYMIFVPLKQSLEGPLALVHVLLTLDIENINDLLKNFLINYLVENHFDHNQIFYEEIKELVTYKDYSIVTIFAIWKCICLAEYKLNALLSILHYSNTPWSPTICAMIKEALKINHPLTEKIMVEVDREPIYIVLNNLKYKLKKETYGTIDNFDMYPIRRIIHCNEPTMLEDVSTVCTLLSAKPVAAHLLLEKYIKEKGAALKVIKNMAPDQLLSFLKISTSLKMKELENGCENNEQLHEYINVMKLARDKISKNLFTKLEKNKVNNNLKCLTTYAKICKHFSSKINIIDIQTQSESSEIFDILLNETLQHISADINNVVRKCSHISSALEISMDEVLLKLCEKSPDLNLLHYTANYTYKVSQNEEVMCLLPVLIMQSIGTKKINMNLTDSWNSSDDIDNDLSNSPVDLNLVKSCVQNAKRIIAKCLIKYNNEEVYQVFNWIHKTYPSNFCDQTENILFKNMFEENISISFNTVDAISDVFSTYVGFACNTNLEVTSKHLLAYTSKLRKYTEDEFAMALNMQLSMQIENLCNNNTHLTACNLLLYLKESLSFAINLDPTITVNVTKILLNCNTKLIQKVFAVPKIDETLTFCLLLFYKYDKALKIIKQALSMYKFDLDKLKVIGQLGINVVQYFNNNDTAHLNLFQRVILLVKWWTKIENLTMTYKNFTTLQNDQLLEKLMQNGHFTKISQINEFCLDFNMDVLPYYKLLLKMLLLNWKPKYNVIENSSGKRCLVMENDEVGLFDDCLEVIQLIPKKESLGEFVSKLNLSINVYYYEVFICIVNIIGYLNSKDVMDRVYLLKFLKNYSRVSMPNDNESEEWFTSFPDTQNIEPLSEWRLPYTATLFTRDIWNILRPEINLNNYTTWFMTIHIFKNNLTKDDICSYAVKEVVSSGLLKSENSNEWALYPKHTDLFEKIDKCLEQISDLERATSAAYHLTIHTPQGSDQVSAAKLSYKYAKLYRNSIHKPEDEEGIKKAYIKVSKKYHSFSAMHILHTYKLADKKYLDLVSSPNELIEALYADNRINKNPIAVKLECPNINAAVDELAQLYSINIFEKRLNMIKAWVSVGSIGDINLDESICVAPPVLTTSDVKSDDGYLKRVSYVCMSGDISIWQQELIELYTSDSISYSKNKNSARALTCYCAIIQEENNTAIGRFSRQELLYHTEKLLLAHDLQCLGVTVDTESFGEKNLLLKLSKDVTNPLSLKIMASICTIFSIHTERYWELIIRNMIKLKMMDEIKNCISVLTKESFMYKQFYIDAWQYLIHSSFDKLKTQGDNFDTVCIENMHFIQSCPVLWRLNLKHVHKKCIDLKRFDLAAILIQYFKDDEKQIYINELLHSIEKNDLISQLKLLIIHGLLGINYVINVIRD